MCCPDVRKNNKNLFLLLARADQGRFLDYVVSWGNLTEEKVALYLREILEALHYLHGWRIAHLDLKVNVCSHRAETSHSVTRYKFKFQTPVLAA